MKAFREGVLRALGRRMPPPLLSPAEDPLMSKLDDLTAWRYFVAFARSGTLTAAATAMDVNTANISRAITGLEKALGVSLVRHNSRPLELTKEGAHALKRMETILRAHDALISQISDDRRSLEGKIRLSSAPGFASRRLTGLLHRFKELHPEMTIEILGGLKEADVQKGFCEVATLTGEPTLSGLVYMSRGRNVYLPVASPEYVKRFGMPFSPENLRTHTGYVYNGPVREETKMLYRGDDAEPVVFDRSVRSTDILAIRQALLDGMGVAVDMPLVQIVEDLRRGALVPILPGWFRPPVECFNVTNRAGWRSRRVRIFFEWYSKAMQDLFASYEAQVSAFVGLPEEKLLYDRNRIYFTDASTEKGVHS